MNYLIQLLILFSLITAACNEESLTPQADSEPEQEIIITNPGNSTDQSDSTDAPQDSVVVVTPQPDGYWQLVLQEGTLSASHLDINKFEFVGTRIREDGTIQYVRYNGVDVGVHPNLVQDGSIEWGDDFATARTNVGTFHRTRWEEVSWTDSTFTVRGKDQQSYHTYQRISEEVYENYRTRTEEFRLKAEDIYGYYISMSALEHSDRILLHFYKDEEDHSKVRITPRMKDYRFPIAGEDRVYDFSFDGQTLIIGDEADNRLSWFDGNLSMTYQGFSLWSFETPTSESLDIQLITRESYEQSYSMWTAPTGCQDITGIYTYENTEKLDGTIAQATFDFRKNNEIRITLVMQWQDQASPQGMTYTNGGLFEGTFSYDCDQKTEGNFFLTGAGTQGLRGSLEDVPIAIHFDEGDIEVIYITLPSGLFEINSLGADSWLPTPGVTLMMQK